MAFDSSTYDPLQFNAGSSEIRSQEVTIPAGQADIPGLTPMKYNASFEAIPATALADDIIGVLVPSPKSVSGNLIGTVNNVAAQPAHIYTDIDLYLDQVDYSAMSAANTDLKKISIFGLTGINIVVAQPGLV